MDTTKIAEKLDSRASVSIAFSDVVGKQQSRWVRDGWTVYVDITVGFLSQGSYTEKHYHAVPIAKGPYTRCRTRVINLRESE